MSGDMRFVNRFVPRPLPLQYLIASSMPTYVEGKVHAMSSGRL